MYVHHVEYYETDQMKIVHHSNYIRWMEEARTAWLKDVGYSYKDMEEGGIVSPVTEVSCKYKKATRYDDTIEIGIKLKDYNRIVLKFEYVMYLSNTDTVVAVGESSHCFLNDKGRPVMVSRELPKMHEFLTKLPLDEILN